MSEVEVYLRGCAIEAALRWARVRLGELGDGQSAGAATVYPSPRGPLIVTPAMEGGPFTSLWFNSPSAPWESDVDCARDAARALGCTVRCAPGGEHRADAGPMTFVEISGETERVVEWEPANEAE